MFVVNSSSDFQHAPAHVFLCLSSSKVHLFNTKSELLVGVCSSSCDANGCDQPKPARGLTHCWDGISKAWIPCVLVRKGLQISLGLGSNWSVFNISSISIFIEKFSMHSLKCWQFLSH